MHVLLGDRPTPWAATVLLGVILTPAAAGILATHYPSTVFWGLIGAVSLLLVARVYVRQQTRRTSPDDRALTRTAAAGMAVWAIRLFIPLAAIRVLFPAIPLLLLVVLSGVAALLAVSTRPGDLRAPPLAGWLLVGTGAISWIVGVKITGTISTTEFLGTAVLALAALLVATAAANLTESRSEELLGAVLDSVAIYLLANVAGYYLLGLRSPVEVYREAMPTSTFDLFGTRITFPLSSSLTTPPAMGAAYLAGYVAVARLSLSARDILRLFGGASAVVVVLASNGRGGLMVAALIAGAALFFPRLIVRYSPVVVTAFLCLPLWWGSLRFVLGPILAWILHDFVRQSEGEFYTIQDRTVVWDVIFDHHAAMDHSYRLMGYGVQGQIPSGVAEQYMHLFRGFFDRHTLYASAHNSLLQQFIDAGYLGVIIFLIAAVGTAVKLRTHLSGKQWSPGERACFSLLLMLVSLAGTGAIEQTIAPGSGSEAFWLFFIIVLTSTRKPAGSSDHVRVVKSLHSKPVSISASSGSRLGTRSGKHA